MTRSSPARWLPFLLLGAVLAAFLPSLSASFQFDDWNVIVGDARVQSLADWWQSMPGIRPLLKLSYALNYTFGSDPAGFRLTNIAIQGVNTCLIAAIFLHYGQDRLHLPESTALFAATCAAVVFGLHPAQTESVTYISGRSNALMAMAALTSILLWMRAGAGTGRAQALKQLASVVALLIAVAVKETAVILPLILWAAHLCQRGTAQDPDALAKPWWQTAAAVAATAALFALPTYRSLLEHSLALRGVGDNLLLAQAHGVSYLLGQVVRLDHMNADPLISLLPLWEPVTLLRLMLITTPLLIALLNIRRRGALAFGILWFFLWLAPTNSLIARNDIANDRQLYLPLAGAGWLLGLGIWQLTAKLRPRVAWLALGSLGLLLGSATILRNQVYATEILFWEDVVEKSPTAARAHNNLGVAYAAQCRIGEAREQFSAALRLDPDYFLAAGNIALLETAEPPGRSSPC